MSDTSLEQRIAELEQRQATTEQSVKNLGGNLKFLRDLVEECVHLTEQSSGIVVEHVTTLDSRLNSIGSIFSDKIKRQLGDAGTIHEKLTVVSKGLETLETSLKHQGIETSIAVAEG